MHGVYLCQILLPEQTFSCKEWTHFERHHNHSTSTVKHGACLGTKYSMDWTKYNNMYQLYYIMQNIFIVLKSIMLLFIHSFLHSQILANTERFIIWNTKNRLLSIWHLLLSDIHLRFSESFHRYFSFFSLIILNCHYDYILYIIRILVFFQIKKNTSNFWMYFR